MPWPATLRRVPRSAARRRRMARPAVRSHVAHKLMMRCSGPNTTGRLISNKGRPLSVDVVRRVVRACARIAGIGHVHPHQLRHTLATQSINNGMSLEAIAQMLGHRSMRMTLVYARIADRTVADEYFAAADKVDQLYTTHLTTSPA